MNDFSTNDTHPPIPDFELPPLPPIADAHLARLATTHSGATFGNRLFEGNGTTADVFADAKDYDKLEHVGDSILRAVVTLLLQELNPSLTPGESTALVSHLGSNEMFAELARRYKITDRLIAHPMSMFELRDNPGTLADMFEAHVAAVYYDYLTSEVPGAFKSAPPSSLPPVGKRTRGGAIDYVFTWLAPLFTPLVQPTLEWIHAKKGGPDSTTIDVLAAYVDAVSVLQMWSQQKYSRNSPPIYDHLGQVGPPHCPMFTMSCTVHTPTLEFKATAARPSKKLAKNAAAYHVAVLMDDAGVRGMRSIPREL